MRYTWIMEMESRKELHHSVWSLNKWTEHKKMKDHTGAAWLGSGSIWRRGTRTVILKFCSVDMNLTATAHFVLCSRAARTGRLGCTWQRRCLWFSSWNELEFLQPHASLPNTILQDGNIPASIASHSVPEMKWNCLPPHSSKCRPNSSKKRHGKHMCLWWNVHGNGDDQTGSP